MNVPLLALPVETTTTAISLILEFGVFQQNWPEAVNGQRVQSRCEIWSASLSNAVDKFQIVRGGQFARSTSRSLYQTHSIKSEVEPNGTNFSLLSLGIVSATLMPR
jgi:hypothetical protein